MTLTFEGTLIYVYFVFPDEDRDTPINVASYLNGESEPSGRYSRQSNVSDGGPPEYLYNVLVFQSTPLPQRKHTLTVTIEAWLSYFDYALYTLDDGSVDPPPESTPSGAPSHSAGVPVSQSPSGSGSLTVSDAQTETKTTLSGRGALRSATLLPLISATEPLSHGSGTPTANASRSPHRPALIAGSIAAAVVFIALLACFCVWRRLRSVAAGQRASSADATISRFVPPPAARDTSESTATTNGKHPWPTASSKALTRTHTGSTSVTPFIAQPDPAPAESEKDSRRAAIIAKQSDPSELGTSGPSTVLPGRTPRSTSEPSSNACSRRTRGRGRRSRCSGRRSSRRRIRTANAGLA